MKYFILLLILALGLSTNIISRNQHVEGMLKRRKDAIVLYEKLIRESEDRIQNNLKMCMKSTKEIGCSSLKMWEHQRHRFSKNITNLQEKIVKHEATIKNILAVNEKEALRKMKVINKLLPKLIKVKNDIEFIEGIQFIIEDSYLNIESGKKSIFQLFNTFPSLIQLSQRKDPGAKPITPEHLPNPQGDLPQARIQHPQGPPLIDEKIFDGHAEQFPRIDSNELFHGENGAPAAEETADEIPNGVNVKEHDGGVSHEQKHEQIVKDYLAVDKVENTMVAELEQGFKHRIKKLGWTMHEKFEEMLKRLNAEHDQLAQAVADLERAIYTMHHQHYSQIVQIYLENKRLQREIYEKDDRVLWLDSKIHDCQNLASKMAECEHTRIVQERIVADLRAQKDINEGVINELKRLVHYADKKVNEPTGVAPEVPKPQVQVEIEEAAAKEETPEAAVKAIEQPAVVAAQPAVAVEQPAVAVEQPAPVLLANQKKQKPCPGGSRNCKQKPCPGGSRNCKQKPCPDGSRDCKQKRPPGRKQLLSKQKPCPDGSRNCKQKPCPDGSRDCKQKRPPGRKQLLSKQKPCPDGSRDCKQKPCPDGSRDCKQKPCPDGSRDCKQKRPPGRKQLLSKQKPCPDGSRNCKQKPCPDGSRDCKQKPKGR